MAQLVERSLPIPEVHGSNLVICKLLYWTCICLLSTVLKRRKYKTMMNAKSCFQIVFDMKCVVEASVSRVNSIVKVKFL